jgi:subtilisin family serine protease
VSQHLTECLLRASGRIPLGQELALAIPYATRSLTYRSFKFLVKLLLKSTLTYSIFIVFLMKNAFYCQLNASEANMRKVIMLSALIALLTGIVYAGSTDYQIIKSVDGLEYIGNQVVVVIKPDSPLFQINNFNLGYAATGVESVDRLCHELGVIKVEPFYKGILRKPALIRAISRMYTFTLETGRDAQFAADELAGDSNIAIAEIRYIPRLFYTPNDPYVDQQWFLEQTHALEAWDIVRGDTTRHAVVGLVDTGLDYHHPDLAANIWVNELEDINHNNMLDPGDIDNIDEDSNGIIDDVIGWDFADDDYDPIGSNPHGTGVAGCISEVTDNDLMGAGIGFSARIMILKAITDGGYLVDGYIPMLYAVENGAKIINCSWGTQVYREFEQYLIDAVWLTGALIIAAGGDGDQIVYPAGYDRVMAVSSTDQNDQRAPFAPYGEYIDICAPGVNLLIPWDDGMSIVSGTSFSAGFVSGLAALLRTWYPDFTNDQIQQLIEDSADPIDDLNPGYEGLLGAGRINCYTGVMTGIDDESENPYEYQLLRNYPNPFNSSTKISYEINNTGDVAIDIFDILGRKVETLINGIQPAGKYSLVWEATGLPSGIYFARLESNDQVTSNKMIFLK